jgi:DNA-3-methyladenine glycosylase II
MTDVLTDLAGRDEVLAELIEHYRRPRLTAWRGSSRFASLARSIVYQQLAGAAAGAIHGRLEDLLGGTVTPETIRAAGTESLRSCGLSRAKASALADLADKVTSGAVRLDRIGRLDDDEVIRHLVQVKGVGRWTAEMFLLFTLGRLDVWPLDDLGVRVGFAHAWSLPAVPGPSELSALGDPFRPYRSVVAWYCWRVAEERRRPPRPS